MTNVFNLQRILLSLGIIVFVGAVVASATGAFFSDTETSTGNTFAAGALDLRVDSEAHFNGLLCTEDELSSTGYAWHADGDPFANDDAVPAGHYPQPGMECTGTWEESDLIADAVQFRFFNLTDIKPGDEGENTISLHVYDNDAWGCFLVDNVVDSDVTCTEPESEDADDPSCSPNGNVAVGELGANLTFDAWLDQGETPGFQNIVPDGNGGYTDTQDDPTEGDNIYQEYEGPLFWNDETVDEASEGPFAIGDVLGGAYQLFCTEDGNANGDNDYGECHGLAADGRMVGSTTYYFGLAWNLPEEVGNEVQTDSLITDMIFEVAQHRNNPNFSCTVPEARTTLTLAKTVIPAEIAPDSAFTLIADNDATLTDPDLSGIEGPTVFFVPVEPGVYDLSETGGPVSTHTVTWECSGNAGGMVDEDTVNVGAGENVVCTVTNDYTQVEVDVD